MLMRQRQPETNTLEPPETIHNNVESSMLSLGSGGPISC